MTISTSTDRPQQRSRSGSLKSLSPERSIASVSDLVSIHSSSSLDGECNSSDHRENYVRSKRSRGFSLPSKLSFKSLFRLCLVIPLFLVSVYLMQKGLRTSAPEKTSEHLRRDGSKCSVPKWTYPNCRPYLTNTGDDVSPLTPDEWYELRDKYEQVVGLNASSLDPNWRDHRRQQQQVDDKTRREVDGFRVPVEIRTSPGRGRGVFLTAPVSKGQIVWDNRYTARFPNECSVREFMDVVDEETACSVIMWGYVNDFFSRGQQFQVDLDGAAFLNQAPDEAQANVVNRFPKELSDPNILHLPVPTLLERRRKPGSFPIYAKDDLPAGTELLLQYSEIHIYGKLFWFDKLCIMSRGLWQWWTMI